jgi:hypothetical protein
MYEQIQRCECDDGSDRCRREAFNQRRVLSHKFETEHRFGVAVCTQHAIELARNERLSMGMGLVTFVKDRD